MAPILKLLLVLLVISLIVVKATAGPKVKFIAVVFRHGDRAPDTNAAEYFPNDPWAHDDFFPNGIGGLTNAGKLREYELGATVRKLYGDFLGDHYLPSDIIARSTDYERTRMSLQAAMAGIYPPSKAQQWHPQLNWQPMIANYVPSNEDVLMIPEECPQYIEELTKVKQLPEIQKKINSFRSFSKELAAFTGKEMKLPNDMFNLWHSLMAESSMGLELPEWTHEIFPNGTLYDGTLLEYEVVSYNQKLKRLNGGMLLRKITESMLDVVGGISKKKMILLSGHETNVASLLSALGVYTLHIPEYGSAVFVELLGDDKGYYVRVRYYLGIPSTVIEKTIPGCTSPCPISDFITLTEDVIPSDDEMICPKKKPETSTEWNEIPSVAELIKRRLNQI